MATLVRYAGGLRRIEFCHSPNGPRQIIRLGRMNAKTAGTIKAMVETIIGDQLANRPHDADTSKWLGGLDEKMLGRLRAVGLADGVGLSQTTLADFLKQCADAMTTKPATRTFYSHARRNLMEFFSAARLVRDVTASDADAWRAWLVEHEKLAPATVARRVIAARTIWRQAIRWRLASENPFSGIKAGHQANDARKVFVPREVIAKVMKAAPDTEWQAIIALARFGGLRCISEVYALRWGDIDHAAGTIRVTVPKLAHIEGRDRRMIPLFPELRNLLLKLFSEAEPGEYVIAKHRLPGLNLGQQFSRIVEQAGVKPWPRLFQNLRASRETELMREYDLATVCKWIGNSPAVAAQHYAMSVDLNADFKRAAAPNDDAEQAQQNAQLSADGGDCQPETSTPQNNEKAPENRGSVDSCQTLASAGVTRGWAVEDLNL